MPIAGPFARKIRPNTTLANPGAGAPSFSAGVIAALPGRLVQVSASGSWVTVSADGAAFDALELTAINQAYTDWVTVDPPADTFTGGGAGIAWIKVLATDIISTRDPFGMEDAAPVDVANGIRVRATTNTTRTSLDNGVAYRIALPAGLCDGGNARLLIRLTLDGPLPTTWAILAGVYEPTLVGFTGGLRWASGPMMMRPVAARAGSFNEGSDVSPTAVVALVYVSAMGAFDGVDPTDGVASSGVADGAVGSNATTLASIAAMTTANTWLVLSLQHVNSGNVDVLDHVVNFEYTLLEAP